MRAGDECPSCGHQLEAARGIEMGHIFQLGTKYAEALDLKVLDQNGKLVTVTMGSYGVGVSRAVAASPRATTTSSGSAGRARSAPADVHVVATGKDEEVSSRREEIARELEAAGLTVIFDDRKRRQPRREVQGLRAHRRPDDRRRRPGLADGTVEVKDRR